MRQNSGLSGCAKSVFAGKDCFTAFNDVFKRSFKPLAALKLGMGKAKRFEQYQFSPYGPMRPGLLKKSNKPLLLIATKVSHPLKWGDTRLLFFKSAMVIRNPDPFAF